MVDGTAGAEEIGADETGPAGLEAGIVDVWTVLVVMTLGVVKIVVDPEVVSVWPTGQVVT